MVVDMGRQIYTREQVTAGQVRSSALDLRARRKQRYRRRRIVAAAALVIVVGAIGGVTAAVFHLRNNLDTAPLQADGATASADSGDPVNILLLASDSRELSSKHFGADSGTQRSDSMVLVHISANNERIDAVQLPRDTMMDLPSCNDKGHGSFPGGRGMLNSALNHGPGCSVKAVEDLSGVTIHHFVEMNFDGFSGIVDALGGVNVCLPQALKDPKANLDLPAGEQHVDGTNALALARTRHAVGDGSDIARMDHQQVVMSAIIQEATSKHTLSKPSKLYPFLNAATKALTVDPGLDSVKSLGDLASRVAHTDSKNITFKTMPWAADPTNTNRVVPGKKATRLFTRINDDRPMVAPKKKKQAPTTTSAAATHKSSPPSSRNAAQSLCDQ